MIIEYFLNKIKTLVFSIFLCFITTTISFAATYYVDPTGNNNTGNGSQSAPWATLSYACSQATDSGDTIQINNGTYSDNNTCNLAIGVDIRGSESNPSAVTINTSVGRYINASSGSKTAGNNDISGIKFVGNGSNPGGGNWWETGCIFLMYRDNSTVHDSEFYNMRKAITAKGKHHSNPSCSAPQNESASWCDNYAPYSKWPNSSDYISNIEIFNNKFFNSKISPDVIKDSTIHDNLWDNTTSYQSAIGNTVYYWYNVDIYNNTINMSTIAWSTIAIEAWQLHDVDVFNNTINGWISLLYSTGTNNPQVSGAIKNLSINDNVFNFSGQRGLGSVSVGAAIEACYWMSDVEIFRNYISSEGRSGNNGYTKAIGVWGYGTVSKYNIYNNVIYDIQNDGDGVISIKSEYSGSNAADIDNIHIYNNIVEKTGYDSAVNVYRIGGDIDNIYIRNNLFMDVRFGAESSGSGLSNLIFEQNYEDSGEYTSGVSWTTRNNLNWADPGLLKSENRPDPYYRPSSLAANIIDAGIDVGLSYLGSAPDIGAYEFNGTNTPETDPPTAPTGLEVTSSP